jgi:hypothetical protein
VLASVGKLGKLCPLDCPSNDPVSAPRMNGRPHAPWNYVRRICTVASARIRREATRIGQRSALSGKLALALKEP